MKATVENIHFLKSMGILLDRDGNSASLEFRKFNLIYGFNGSGKTTLSRLFSSLEAGVIHPKLPADGEYGVTLSDGKQFSHPEQMSGLERRIIVFNMDYIEKNLQWHLKRANPVFFIGEDQANAAAELEKIIDRNHASDGAPHDKHHNLARAVLRPKSCHLVPRPGDRGVDKPHKESRTRL